MSEFDMTDDVEPEERPEPEEYEASEREEVSDETGTVYDPTGQAETTPQDLEVGDDDDDEDGSGGGGSPA
jgi:hypothetical protein